MLTLQPYQQAQASMSTGVGGFGLWSAEARRVSASVGSLVAIVPEVLADLPGAIRDKVRRELLDSNLVRRIWHNVRDLRDVHGVSRESMASIVPESWRDRVFEHDSKVPQRNQLQTCCPHTMPKLSAPAKHSRDWVNW